jgi:hypothetical protein
MNKKQYLAALKALELTPASKKTAEALGLSVRHIKRLASGERKVPKTLAILIHLLLERRKP